MTKELRRITVETLPNGYALTVGSENYMYFTTDELLDGFMYHVGLNEIGCIDTKTIKDFLVAAVAWRADCGRTAKEILRLTEENRRLTSIVGNNRRSLKRMKERIAKYGSCDDFDDEDEQ